MRALDLIVIFIGIWGCIYLIGEIITEIAEMKVNANPINKLFNVKKEEEK